MIIRNIHLKNFRSHKETLLSFYPKGNIIYGKNGIGKTNILEAIYIGMLTKSFLPIHDSECLRFEKEKDTSKENTPTHFEIDIGFLSDVGVEKKTRVYYSKEEGKNFLVDGTKLHRFADSIGTFPCVAYSPYDNEMIIGGPDLRRKFIDATISQANRSYLLSLLEYRKALQQRNTLLEEMKYSFSNEKKQIFNLWTETLCRIASKIIFSRIQFIQEFMADIKEAYTLFDIHFEIPTLIYFTSVSLSPEITEKEIEEKLLQKIIQRESEEIHRGYTLVGPHRDDVEFRINDFSLKKYASQGQNKTFMICLKIAQKEYLYKKTNECPVFLLDDAFAELDDYRSERLLASLLREGQFFITSTKPFIENEHNRQIDLQHVI